MVVAAPSSSTSARIRDDDMERALGRAVALGLPAVSVVSAVALGFIVSVGSALLALAAGALLGAIGLLWASVRTLSGDAPLTAAFDSLKAETPVVDALVEEKRRLLRSLKDLENEHELGKINDADYQQLLMHYRDEAKSVLRTMDGRVAPFREEAERLARDYLSRHGLGPPPPGKVTPSPAVSPSARIVCEGCAASNEPDATFCKQCGSSLKIKEHTGAES
jgi:ribosomal protein L40E